MIEQLDAILKSEVFGPWEEKCQEQNHPWEATPELRAQWVSMCGSKDPHVSLAGGVALARTVHLSIIERRIMERYFFQEETLSQLDLPLELLMAFLLSGASPPHRLCQAYLLSPVKENRIGEMDLNFANHLSLYLRTPEYGGTALRLDDFGSEGDFIRYLVSANPTVGRPVPPSGPWFDALNTFLGKDWQRMPKTDLEVLAVFLRTAGEEPVSARIIRTLAPDPALAEGVTRHPFLTKGIRPELDHTNPSREVIVYFSENEPVSNVWRFYSRLLMFPWQMDPAGGEDHPMTYLGKLLCGLSSETPYTGGGGAIVQTLTRNHPLLQLASHHRAE